MPKLQCNVSGLWFSVTTNHKKELVEKFESEDNLIDTYVSRDARRLRKEGKSDEDIRNMAEAGEITSLTPAPKRALKRVSSTGKKNVPTPKVATKPDVSEKPTGKPVDPDIENFMSGTIAEGSAADKAV